MPKYHTSKKVLTGPIVAVFLLCLVSPCFSEPLGGVPTHGRVLLAEEKGIIDRAKDAIMKKARDLAVEKAKRDAKKKIEDSVKAAKKKLDDLKK